MLRRFHVPLAILAAVPCVAAGQAHRCTDSTVTGGRVGAVRIGMSLDSVRAECPIIRDTTEMDEGEPGRVVYALLAGDTARIDVLDNAVEFVRVLRPRFVTTDSIRPGMSLTRFLRARRPEIVVGEGKVFLIDDSHCGNSFGLSAEAYAHVSYLTKTSLARLPPSTVIDEIVVTGVSARAPYERCN